MPTAFVTGATGFLGLNLVEQLTRRGWTVTALHRATSDLTVLRSFPVTLAQGDILDRAALEAGMPQGVDAVFHTAANTSIWSRHNAAQTRDNVEGTTTVLSAARARGAKRFVHVSTWNTYGLEHYEDVSEDTPQRGAESWVNYTRSKTLAEMEVKRAAAEGFGAVIVNPSHIMGRYDSANWARMVFMVRDDTLPGAPPGAGSFCHAEAVAEAMIAAAERGRVGHNYLLGGTDSGFPDLLALIAGELGKPPPRTLPAFAIKLAARAKVALSAITGREPDLTPEGASMVLAHPRIASTKAADELGYRTVPLVDMVRDCMDWLRRTGRL